jgi:hypothetical protein
MIASVSFILSIYNFFYSKIDLTHLILPLVAIVFFLNGLKLVLNHNKVFGAFYLVVGSALIIKAFFS